MSNQNYFENNIAEFGVQAKAKSNRLNMVGTLRVVWFLSFLIVFVYFANIRQLELGLLSFLIFIIGFGLLVIWYNRLKFSQDQFQNLIKINEQELQRLNMDLGQLPDGNEFSDSKHRYTNDLDIFGANSVYQLINRTSTIPGKDLFSRRLKGEQLPVDHSDYQDSVREIARLPQFIQDYQAYGMHFEIGPEDYDSFSSWLEDDGEMNLVKRNSILLYVLPAIFLIGFVITTVLSITYYTLLPLIAINLYLLAVNHSKTSQVVEQTSSVVKLLKTYIYHIRLIRETKFSSSFTLSLYHNLINEANDAEKEIHELSRLLDHLQARTNLLHIFINIPLLLDLQWMSRLSQWKEDKRDLLKSWMSSLAEFETLVSLGGTSFLNPDWCYPAMTDEEYILHGKGFGHPMIKAGTRVYNDFTLRGPSKAVIITGPNMAGKSTFLRTIALNVVLAQMGGAVCASEVAISKNMKVFTAMRSQDNLSENISSFYAELDRIHQLLNYIETGNKVLYFLDELLKGTNSADRHRGAEALVKQLISLKVSGFVSTHDIELGELTQQLDEVSNYSFESTITNGQINFDYKIREGVCSSFNASELMRQMGINV